MPHQDFTPLRESASSPTIEDRWEELRSNIRKMWPELSKADLQEIGGDSRKLIVLVHQKTGAAVHEIEERIDELAASSEGLLSRVARTTQHALGAASEQITAPLSHAYTATRQQVADSPVRSVGIAFGAGILIGLCVASLIVDVQEPPSRRWW